MANTFQRKFLMPGLPSTTDASSVRTIKQAYWRLGDGWSLRLRHEVTASGDESDSLTIKGKRSGASAFAFKLALGAMTTTVEKEARAAFFAAAGEHVVQKTRMDWSCKGHDGWVDAFLDRNAGLVVAEFEHDNESDSSAMPFPDGALREITAEIEYVNESLAYRPFKSWT